MAQKQSLSRVVFNIFNYTFFIAFLLLVSYPLWFIIIYTISDPELAQKNMITIYPLGFSLYNLKMVFQLDSVFHSMLISIARTIAGTVLTVLSCMILGYIFSKNDVPFRKFMYRMLVITMYVSGGLIPMYLVIKAYGLMNNFWVYILPAVSAYYVVLIKTYIEQLPASLEESAKIDGANNITIFFKIIFPLSIPIVATIAVYASVREWNDWWYNYIYTFMNPKLTTLMYLLYKYLNEAERILKELETGKQTSDLIQRSQGLTPMGVRMTITLITVFPILCVYPFLQRFFIKGIMIGAVKG